MTGFFDYTYTSVFLVGNALPLAKVHHSRNEGDGGGNLELYVVVGLDLSGNWKPQRRKLARMGTEARVESKSSTMSLSAATASLSRGEGRARRLRTGGCGLKVTWNSLMRRCTCLHE